MEDFMKHHLFLLFFCVLIIFSGCSQKKLFNVHATSYYHQDMSTLEWWRSIGVYIRADSEAGAPLAGCTVKINGVMLSEVETGSFSVCNFPGLVAGDKIEIAVSTPRGEAFASTTIPPLGESKVILFSGTIFSWFEISN
jgi:hypothetical protein